MSIRSVNCPKCGATANIPAAMANVRCGSCGFVWNVNEPVQTPKPSTEPADSGEPKNRHQNVSLMALVAFIVGGMLFMVIIGMMVVGMSKPSDATADSAAATESQTDADNEETIKPRDPEPYRIVRLPEDQRKRVYNDYRKVARTTVEKPLMLPQGGARKMMEDMLQKTFERELRRFAAANDVTYEDILEIIKEGDAKNWDPSPRSNAKRDGKRVYPSEKSEGYSQNSNVR